MALEFLQDLEHSRMVEAEFGGYPFAQGAGMEIGGLDFGHLLDDWEHWAELGCSDKLYKCCHQAREVVSI